MITNYLRMRDAFLLTRVSTSTVISSHITLLRVITTTVLGRLISIVSDTASLPVEVLLPVVVALAIRCII